METAELEIATKDRPIRIDETEGATDRDRKSTLLDHVRDRHELLFQPRNQLRTIPAADIQLFLPWSEQPTLAPFLRTALVEFCVYDPDRPRHDDDVIDVRSTARNTAIMKDRSLGADFAIQIRAELGLTTSSSSP